MRFLRLLNWPGILLLITGCYTAVLMVFYRNTVAIEIGVVTVVLGLGLAIVSGQGLRDRNIVLGFIGLLIIPDLFALENIDPFLAIISAVAIVLVVLLLASVVRGRGVAIRFGGNSNVSEAGH